MAITFSRTARRTRSAPLSAYRNDAFRIQLGRRTIWTGGLWLHKKVQPGERLRLAFGRILAITLVAETPCGAPGLVFAFILRLCRRRAISSAVALASGSVPAFERYEQL